MTNGSLITTKGKNILLYRAYTENADLSTTEYLAPSQFKVGVSNGTPNVADTDLDTPVIISGGLYLGDFSSGYPAFDHANNEVTIRCYLNSLQANGNLINALGIFNKDTSSLMTGEDVFTGESKSDTDEFVFVIKNRVL